MMKDIPSVIFLNPAVVSGFGNSYDGVMRILADGKSSDKDVEYVPLDSVCRWLRVYLDTYVPVTFDECSQIIHDFRKAVRSNAQDKVMEEL